MTTVRLAITTAYGSMSPENIARALDLHTIHRGGRTLTSLRLAYNPGPVNQYKALAPTVRLALVGSPPERGGPTLETEMRPALLVSFVYLDAFLKNQKRYSYRDWVLDSGAFSAWKSGTEIDLQKYIDTCAKLLESDPKLTEVFSLDVIGNWEGTARNTEEMWKQGIPAIPAFHYGEPEEALKEMAERYPKIALGGIVGVRKKEKKRWIGQCFARVWPKRIHGFGVGSKEHVMAFPFHSVDATNWEIGPCAFGRWNSFGKMSIRGSKQDLRAEVEWYLDLERSARLRWKKEMTLLDSLGDGPVVRLAEVSSGRFPVDIVSGNQPRSV